MLVKDVKPIGKIGKDLLENKNVDEIIETIIEKPLQKACKECKNKNIVTVMSSANRNNIVKRNKKRVEKKDILKGMEAKKFQTFYLAGYGYVWLMIDYFKLSNENKEILYSLEKELGEETIWFVEPTYVQLVNPIRKSFGFEELDIYLEKDKYEKQFQDKKIRIMYSNIYPRRSVFIRMPVNENTDSKEVEEYFSNIICRLEQQ